MKLTRKQFQGFRDSKGRFISKKFIEESIKPLAERDGTTVFKYFKQNKKEIVDVYEHKVIKWKISGETATIYLDENYNDDKVFVDDGNGFVKYSAHHYSALVQIFENFINYKADEAGYIIIQILYTTTRDLRNKNMKTYLPDKSNYIGLSYREIKNQIAETFGEKVKIYDYPKRSKKAKGKKNRTHWNAKPKGRTATHKRKAAKSRGAKKKK